MPTKTPGRGGRLWILPFLLGSALLEPGSAPAATPGVISDLQTVKVGATHYRVLLRSNGPVAYDCLTSSAGALTVRLYRSTLGKVTLPDTSAFGGTLAVTQEAGGNSVLVSLSGVSNLYTLSVHPGRDPSSLELRIDH